MAWTQPQYTRADIDRAGDYLVGDGNSVSSSGGEPTIEEIHDYIERYERTFNIINNWRSSHSYPLQVIKMTLLTRAKRVDSQAIIAQRLKRLSSIVSKLQRNENMKLSQMQDLGGCRAVLGTPRLVNKLVEVYEKAAIKNPRDRPEFSRAQHGLRRERLVTHNLLESVQAPHGAAQAGQEEFPTHLVVGDLRQDHDPT